MKLLSLYNQILEEAIKDSIQVESIVDNDKIIFLRNIKYSNSGTKKHLPWNGIHAWAVKTSDLNKFFEQAYFQGSDKKNFIEINPQDKKIYALNMKLADDYVKGNSDIEPKLEKFNPNKHVLRFRKLSGKQMYQYHSDLEYQILMNPTNRNIENLTESVKDNIHFEPISNPEIFNFLKKRRYSDKDNKETLVQFTAKNNKKYIIKKVINQDVFKAIDVENLENQLNSGKNSISPIYEIGFVAFDTTNPNYITGYKRSESILINPEFRRLGIATALTKFAENYYKVPYKPTDLLSPEMQGFVKSYNSINENKIDKIILKSKSDKGNRYFEMLRTAKFQHYDSPKGELSTFNKGEEDRKRLVSKLSVEDKKKYKEWLKTPEGKESLKLFKKYETKFDSKVLKEERNDLREISLKQAIELSQLSDIEDVGTWLGKDIKNIKFYYKLESINLFLSQINEMESTYDEFPEDEERTEIIYKLLKDRNKPKAIFVKLNDSSKFVMEGRHRMVAFKWIGLNQIPVIYVN